MPIRFVCAQCQQRLSVAGRKAGQEVKCPRCRHIVRVPDAPGPDRLAEAPGPEDAIESLVGELSAAEPVGELVYGAVREDLDADGTDGFVQVPRRVVYLQGLLLGVVALAFFIFGLIVGGRARERSNGFQGTASVVSGVVSYTLPNGNLMPDAGSVVVLVPASVRPDEKVPVRGLAPADASPDATHPGLRVIRDLGGDYARADQRGRYRLGGVGAGSYFLLIISAHQRRSNEAQLRARDLAEMGRYFLPATELIGDFRHDWREIQLTQDQRLDIRF